MRTGIATTRVRVNMVGSVSTCGSERSYLVCVIKTTSSCNLVYNGIRRTELGGDTAVSRSVGSAASTLQ